MFTFFRAAQRVAADNATMPTGGKTVNTLEQRRNIDEILYLKFAVQIRYKYLVFE
jgi:hypothetical protein